MRPLLLFLASLVAFSTAQGVTQLEPTTADLARLLGDVTSLEVAIPRGAQSVRIAFTMGEEGGYSENIGPLWPRSQPSRNALLKLLILAPGLGNTHGCGGEPIDILITYPNGDGSGTTMCVTVAAGAEPGRAQRKHEQVLTGSTPELEEWTPIYLRAWSPIEMGVSGSGSSIDLDNAFTIQVMFSAAEFEDMPTDPPLDAGALRRIQQIHWR